MRLSILAAAFAALAATSASAAAVATFDLTFDGFGGAPVSVGPGATVTSDRGTTLTINAFGPSGNPTNYHRDGDASGARLTNVGLNGLGLDTPGNVGPLRGVFTPDYLATYQFANAVQLQSIDFLIRATDGSATVGVGFDGGGIATSILNTGNPAPTTPAIFTLTFGGANPAPFIDELAILGGSDVFSVKSITVFDPVAPIPLPAAAWLLLGGLGALGAVARKRAA